ncbi:hypothetical protein LUQ84_000691 [Hamiltosporidium tvaerminnensis]|nr:hypothetical protein LUQ84_000691 [Hamiltosporidium tvaerminnensis]
MYLRKYFLITIVLIFINYKLILCDQDISISSLPNPIIFKRDVIFKKYKVISYLGHGVQGSVFLIEDIQTKEKFALKVQPKKTHLTCNYIAELFKNYLRHENIVKFYGYYNDSNYEYLLFEYLPITLLDYLDNNKETFINFLFIMKQMLDVLNFLRVQKIVIGDFKFDNMMLAKNLKIKAIDFGHAVFEKKQKRLFSDKDIKNGKNNHKKYLYIAPEIRNGQRCSSIADIYSFGYVSREYINDVIIKDGKVSDFFEHCLVPDPKIRISADVALIHPIFNTLYDFVFCFADIKNFEISDNDTKIKLHDRIIYYEHPEYSFELHCCCSKNKREFSKFKLNQNQKLLQRKTTNQEEAEQRAYKLLKFRAVVGNHVLPIQHLTFSYHNELKKLFLKLNIEQVKYKVVKNTLKEKTTRKKIMIKILGISVLIIVIAECLLLSIIYRINNIKNK